MKDREPFHRVYAVNIAYAQLALGHPDELDRINAAWFDHLRSAGWTPDAWGSELLRVRQELAVRDNLAAQGMPQEVINRALEVQN
jgi:hypothetical protein